MRQFQFVWYCVEMDSIILQVISSEDSYRLFWSDSGDLFDFDIFNESDFTFQMLGAL